MQDTKIFKILSYIGPLFLISLFIPQKDDSGVKLHCGQGMLLFVTEIILSIILGVVCAILLFIPIIGWIIATLLSFVCSIGLLILAIIGIINAATNKDVPVPIIGRFAFYK